MKLQGKPNSLTGKTSLSSAPSIRLCLPTGLTREQSKILEKQQCLSGYQGVLLVDRDCPAEPQKTLLEKVTLKGRAVWEAGEKAGMYGGKVTSHMHNFSSQISTIHQLQESTMKKMRCLEMVWTALRWHNYKESSLLRAVPDLLGLDPWDF